MRREGANKQIYLVLMNEMEASSGSVETKDGGREPKVNAICCVTGCESCGEKRGTGIR